MCWMVHPLVPTFGNYPFEVGTLVRYHEGGLEVIPVYVPRELRKGVGFLCSALPGDENLEPTPLGTCFFVLARNSLGQNTAYLVTAKHVLRELRGKGKAWVRLDRGLPGDVPDGVTYVEVPLNEESWLEHGDESVDVAVHRWTPKGHAFEFHFLLLSPDNISDAIDHLRKNGFNWPPLEAEDIVFIGMMRQFLGKQSNLPIVRRGSIALVTEERLNGEYGPSEYYVIESQIYPGNSGSPVFAIYGNIMTPLGVLAFAYPTLEELKRREVGSDEYYYNYGLALVTPIEKVMDVINSPQERDRRDQTVDPMMKGEAMSAGEPETFTRSDFEQALQRVSRRQSPRDKG